MNDYNQILQSILNKLGKMQKLEPATISETGLMSSDDKFKLDNLIQGAVQKFELADMYPNPAEATDVRLIMSELPPGLYIWYSEACSNITIPDISGSNFAYLEWNSYVSETDRTKYDGILTVRSIDTCTPEYRCSLFSGGTAYTDWIKAVLPLDLIGGQDCQWSDTETGSNRYITQNTLAYWNGAYNEYNGSNLAYCNKGAFGSIITKNAEDYLPATGGTLTGVLNMQGGNGISARHIDGNTNELDGTLFLNTASANTKPVCVGGTLYMYNQQGVNTSYVDGSLTHGGDGTLHLNANTTKDIYAHSAIRVSNTDHGCIYSRHIDGDNVSADGCLLLNYLTNASILMYGETGFYYPAIFHNTTHFGQLAYLNAGAQLMNTFHACGTTSNYNSCAIEVREANYAGVGTGDISEAPAIGFHWAGRVASTMLLDANNYLTLYQSNGSLGVLKTGWVLTDYLNSIPVSDYLSSASRLDAPSCNALTTGIVGYTNNSTGSSINGWNQVLSYTSGVHFITQIGMDGAGVLRTRFRHSTGAFTGSEWVPQFSTNYKPFQAGYVGSSVTARYEGDVFLEYS